jgi:hypothetical protein
MNAAYQKRSLCPGTIPCRGGDLLSLFLVSTRTFQRIQDGVIFPCVRKNWVSVYILRLFERVGGKPALPNIRCSKNGNVRSLKPKSVGIPIRMSIVRVAHG